VTQGRLTGPFWLKLVRKGHTFTGYTSPDGKTWTTFSSAEVPLKKIMYVGLPAASGLKKGTTTIRFDQVKAPGWK
jgi:regulation of enolase protein 1 (concanavalin A-like superfamily)